MRVLKKALAGLLIGTMLVSSLSTPAYATEPSLDKSPFSVIGQWFGVEPRALSVNTSGLNQVSGYDFIVDTDNIGYHNMSFTTNMAGWHTRNESDGVVSADKRKILVKDYPNGFQGETKYDGTIAVRFSGSVRDGANNRYDLLLTLSNIWFNAPVVTYQHTLMEFFEPGVDTSTVGIYGNKGTWCTVNYQVVNRGTSTPVDGTLLMSFADLDRPGMWQGSGKDVYDGMHNYTESVRLDGGVVSPVYLEPNHYLKIANGNTEFIATRGTTGLAEEKRAGLSFLGNARGTRVTFALYGAGTSMVPTTMDLFKQYTATTYVRYQQKDGSWGGYSVANRQTLPSGMAYSYTWSHANAGVSSSVYATPSNATVGVSAMRGNQEYYISVPRKQYTHRFDANKPGGEAVSGMPGDVTRYAENAVGSVSSPTSKNFTFSGWNTQANGNGSWLSSGTSMLSNQTWYAQWAAKSYTMTYVKNAPSGSTGGDSNVTLSKTSQTVKYNKPWGELATASKPGYTFMGWYTERDGGVRITSDTIAKGNLTVYAHWAPVEYTIRFNGNGDKSGCDVTGSMPSIKVKYDQPIRLPANQFKATIVTPAEDEGGEAVVKPSVFNGWNQNADAMRPSLADKASVMNLVSANGAVVDLYAVWDNAPMFIVESYPDRYFTLEEAQNGDIDEEELLSTVVVKDRETSPLPHKTTEQVESGDDVGVSIVGWDASEFTDMTDDGVVSIRYQVKDEAGNKAYLNIKVTVTSNGPLPAEEYSFYRAISDKYTDTLPAESRWLTDYTYRQALGDAFSGEAKTHSYTLNSGLLDEIRAYVKTHGFGNSENPDALNGLFGSFGD